MIDFNSEELSFQTDSEVEAYCRFFLSVRPSDSTSQFETKEELEGFDQRRERNLRVHLDELRELSFGKANRSKVEGTFYKLCKSVFQNPLSSEGSARASTRFNYKEISLLKNKTIYLGKSKTGCEIEMFHLEDQRNALKRKFDPKITLDEDEIPFPDYHLHEYHISLDNVLILTSKPCCDAIGIKTHVILNEWFEVNFHYQIPTCAQILATMARTQGYKGILYTSTRVQTETNLVIFEENAGELELTPVHSIKYHPSDWLIKT